MAELPEPIPAATLVLMRERAHGPPELLMTERTGQMAFAAGALVFPGGRIDAEDREAAANFAETRRFDTLFFLAEAPAGAPAPSVSEHEAVRAFWASAAEILGELGAGR